MTLATWLCLAPWVLWLVVRVFGLERGFPLVPLISFTPWMALASVLPIAVAALARRRGAAIAAAVTAVAFAAIVLPRAFGGPSDAEGGDGATLRVLAVNVEFGKADAGELVALAEELEADALAVSELTPRFAEQLADAGIGDVLPHTALAPAPRASGTGIFSALPLRPAGTATLPGGFALARATLDPGAGSAPFELLAAHTVPPTDWGAAAWRDDLEAIPGTSEETIRIAAGDFNATLDHDAFRELLDRGYDDAAEVLGDGLAFTWPVGRRIAPTLVAIDHVLVDERVGVREFATHEIGHTDHRAVFAELVLPAAG